MLLPEFTQQFKILVTHYNKVSFVKIRLVNVTTVTLTLTNTFVTVFEEFRCKSLKCYLIFSSRKIIFIKLVYLSSVNSLKWQ